jgi:hypothetical protein
LKGWLYNDVFMKDIYAAAAAIAPQAMGVMETQEKRTDPEMPPRIAFIERVVRRQSASSAARRCKRG